MSPSGKRKINGGTVIAIAAIIAAGTAARILFALYMPTVQLYDFVTYQTLAENIKNGLGHTLDGVPVAWQGPLYPYVLGFFYRLIGSSDEIFGKMLNILFSAFTLVFCYFIYKKLFVKSGKTLAALAVTAFLPVYVAYVNVLGTEIFFTFLLSAIIFFQLNFQKKWFLPCILGVLAGLAALTKPFMLAYPAVCAVIYWWQTGKKLKKTCVYVLLTVVFMCAAVAPWTFRNYREFERFIPVSYNSGYVLYINNNVRNENGAWMDLSQTGATDALSGEINKYLAGPGGLKAAAELEPVLKNAALEYIKSNPLEFLKLGVLRVYETFFTGSNDVSQWAMNGWTPNRRDRNLWDALLNIISFIFSVSALIFAFTGVRGLFAASAKHRTDGAGFHKSMITLNIVFFTAVVFVFEGQARYAFPVYLFMICAFMFLITDKKTVPALPNS